jgi:hypothetical protein
VATAAPASRVLWHFGIVSYSSARDKPYENVCALSHHNAIRLGDRFSRDMGLSARLSFDCHHDGRPGEHLAMDRVTSLQSDSAFPGSAKSGHDRETEGLPARLDAYAKRVAQEQPDVAKGLGVDNLAAMRKEKLRCVGPERFSRRRATT